jgi:pimeloyl-ACP methyl ester carboxylesterase
MCQWEYTGMSFCGYSSKHIKMDHQQINVWGTSVHVVVDGNPANQPILFLHGYPENWAAFENVMQLLKDNYYVLAIDLPGIGKSEPIHSGNKYPMADFINQLIQALELERIVLAGHDIGGMTTYAFIKHFPEKLLKAVIMDTVIPGVSPWEEVRRNPYIWHFALYAVPELPETLAAGKQRVIFDYFYNTLSYNKQAIDEHRRNEYAHAYETQVALKTSFDWYRAFPHDEKDNSVNVPVDVPVLYLRGEKESGNMQDYVTGLQKSGLHDLSSKLIAASGHFSPEEQPQLVAEAIQDFVGYNDL